MHVDVNAIEIEIEIEETESESGSESESVCDSEMGMVAGMRWQLLCC